MRIGQLLQWQWKDYEVYHRNRSNLLLHIVAVPLFLLSMLALIGSLCLLSIAGVVVSLACVALSLAIQGRGHRLEPMPPVPFSSRGNAVARLLLEQWITFPRFVLSGGWYRNLTKADRQADR